MTTLKDIRDDFALLDDWEDRFRYVIELGKALPAFPEAERTDTNKVRGCASQVWLSTQVAPGGDGVDPCSATARRTRSRSSSRVAGIMHHDT